jgi:hypothetical protein
MMIFLLILLFLVLSALAAREIPLPPLPEEKEGNAVVYVPLTPLNVHVLGEDLCRRIRAVPDTTVPIRSLNLVHHQQKMTYEEGMEIARAVLRRLNDNNAAEDQKYYILNLVAFTKAMDEDFNTFYTVSFMLHDKARTATHAFVTKAVVPNVSKQGFYVTALYPREMTQRNSLT